MYPELDCFLYNEEKLETASLVDLSALNTEIRGLYLDTEYN